MRPLDFPLLTDENIAADVVAGLRARGCDVRSAEEERLIGRGDGEVLERATALHRKVGSKPTTNTEVYGFTLRSILQA